MGLIAIAAASIAAAGYVALTSRERGETAKTESPVPSSEASASPAREAKAAFDLEETIGRTIESVVSIISDEGRGSGFLVDPRTVITNHHVVGASRSVLVKLSNGSALSGTVERIAEAHDLALVRLDRDLTDRRSLELASVSEVRVGQEVYVIGSPMGVLESSVTRGIVSAIRPFEGATLVQTDAAINPGNSGGPLLDRSGRVVGIATMKVAEGESIGFAVAADHARELLQGGGRLASEVALNPSTGLRESLGGTAAPASSREESELLSVVDSARPQFEALARAVGNCPDIAREFEGDGEDEALMRLGRIVLEYVDQRRVFANSGRHIPEWNRMYCMRGAESTIAACYQTVSVYDELYKSYVRDAARRGERPRLARQFPEI
ncbi:MAG TPA: trypsin-like peptidase domain-containing protein [Vicinamibacteria bacterium]